MKQYPCENYHIACSWMLGRPLHWSKLLNQNEFAPWETGIKGPTQSKVNPPVFKRTSLVIDSNLHYHDNDVTITIDRKLIAIQNS